MSAVYNNKSNTTIAVGLSGGVDSAVAAALLKKQGYKVVAFFMKNWSDKFGLKEVDCPWFQDRQDAMAVAAKLDIPFHTLDFEDEYKKEVLDYFFSEYQAGRTPNPDVFCNSQIKFGVFLKKALELGADKIATGHYARLRREETRNKKQDINNNQNSNSKSHMSHVNCQLLKSKDQNKDQTYFLYRLNQGQLSKTMFPIGEYTKPEIRKLAKKFGLPNHNKPDSQGVCFVGHLDLHKFLSQKIKDKPGDIILAGDENTFPKKVGEHKGLFWYTIGQRKGIEIGGIGPFYVLEKDLKNNQLIVVNKRDDKRLYKKEILVGNMHWIDPSLVETRYTASKESQGMFLKCTGRIRYREPLVDCQIKKVDSSLYHVTFAEPVWAVAPGQSVVFYDKEVCLGGGIIQ